VSGYNQSAKAGTALANPIRLLLVDRYNNGIGGQVATFIVNAGGGHLSSNVATSDANGVFDVPAWTMGKSAVPQSVQVSIASLTTSVSAIVQTSYNIQVRFFGPAMSVEQKALFENAAARISGIITGDIIDANAVNFDVGYACGISGVAPLNEVVDDLVIYASIGSIDGPGNILAQAGPCAFRSPTYRSLTAVGVMRFDIADMAAMAGDGSLQDVITHEMLHVIGIGSTFWSMNGYLVNPGTPQVGYIGSQARQGCFDAGGFATCASMVPVENVGSPGTAGSHWRESVFGNELMTGFANAGALPISMITVGSLFDIGYTINPSAADLFRPGTFAARSGQSTNSLNGGRWEELNPGNPQILHTDGRVEPAPRK
jgi:hypothetical protein